MDTNEIINQLREENQQLKLRLKNQDVMITANLGVRGQIKKAAFELGYHGSMEADELDYLIETARATVMVNQKNVELQSQLVAVQDSVVHGKCANSEPCATFCEAIATRKMFKQLQVERDGLLVYAIDAEKWFNKHDPHGYVSPKRADAQAVLAAHNTEVAKAAYAQALIDNKFDLSIADRPDLIERIACNYAAQLRAKAGA